jgi:murein DD-endopeptidase MepM/ murein hydrolase activator NlpD
VAADSVLIRLDRDRTLAVRDAASSPRAELRETPVREVRRTHVGCIESSLYGALEASAEGEDLSPLALELDRIYGGVVDFYSDLHPGDCVAIVYGAFVRPDGSARLGAIESAELVNRGVSRAAIWFEAPDGTSDWYDADGNSLRRQFLRSPLKFTRISSRFTMRRFHPILKRYRAHPAIDYVAPAGTPVQAAGNGVVTHAGWKGGYGKFVELQHGKVYRTSYAHLSRIAAGLRPGRRVSQGEVIGYVGSTGLSTSAHLDYRFTKNGRFVNPLSEDLPTGEPVPAAYGALFAERKERALELLEDAYRTVLVRRDGGEPGFAATALGAAALPLPGVAAGAEGAFGDD